jgi:protein involved in polysaccharide export with SLBB domain
LNNTWAEWLVSAGTMAVCAALVLGCARTDTMRIDAGARTQQAPPTSTTKEEDVTEDPGNLAQLEQLWSERETTDSKGLDYPIGPGDVLTISVPEIDQLAHSRARVSIRGTIELPLIGFVQAAGLSEDGLATEIDAKLEKYMYKPQTTVFVDEYRNREAAVIGAVNRPGLVLLDSPSETLLDVMTQAGGLSAAASDEVILIPSRPGGIAMARALASSSGQRLGNEPAGAVAASGLESGNLEGHYGEDGQLAINDDNQYPGGRLMDRLPSPEGDTASAMERSADQQPSPPVHSDGFSETAPSGGANTQFEPAMPNASHGAIGSRQVKREPGSAVEPMQNADQAMRLAASGDALTINLKGTLPAGVGKYVNMPMRPGDVVIVPGGGDVMVVGWVHQPGRFQAGSGLTVLGAIGAAGGPMYAANTKNIALIRTEKRGSKVTIPVDMEKITTGDAVDLPVQANDVIDVPYSGLRIGPYIFYSILTKVGIAGPIIPPY